MDRKLIAALSLVLLSPLFGCNKGGSAAGPSAAAQQEAREIFSTRCAACHGVEGTGDGPGAAGLTPKPRNLRDRAWQTEASDDSIDKIIVLGGPAVGKSATMPPNADLAELKEIVTALRLHIRSLGK